MIKHETKAVKEEMVDYHQNEAIGASMIKTMIMDSPAHYKHWHVDRNVKDATPAMKFGALCHMAMLEAEVFNDRFVIEREFKGKGSVAAYEEWASSLPNGTIVLSQKEYQDISGMVMALFKFPDSKNLMKKTGIKEHSFYFTDPETGLPCKFRPDFLTDDEWLIDIKTTTRSERGQFMRDVRPMGYHITAAHYLHGYKQVFGREAKGYIFLAIEKKVPYIPCVFTADNTITEPGEIDRRKGMAKIKRCLESNTWLGYQENGPENLSLPHYELNNYEEVLP